MQHVRWLNIDFSSCHSGILKVWTYRQIFDKVSLCQGHSYENLELTLCFPRLCSGAQNGAIPGGLLPTLTHAKTLTNSLPHVNTSTLKIANGGKNKSQYYENTFDLMVR